MKSNRIGWGWVTAVVLVAAISGCHGGGGGSSSGVEGVATPSSVSVVSANNAD